MFAEVTQHVWTWPETVAWCAVVVAATVIVVVMVWRSEGERRQ